MDMKKLNEDLFNAIADGGTVVARADDPSNLNKIRHLLDSGANPNAQVGAGGDTMLHMAIQKRNVDACRLLLERGANPNRPAYEGADKSLLHMAVSMQTDAKYEVSEMLIKHGAYLLSRDGRGKNVFDVAHSEDMKDKLDFWANEREKEDWAKLKSVESDFPLHKAAEAGDVGTIQRLLSEGFDLGARNANNATALHCAAFYGNEDVVELLLKAGASVHVQNDQGAAPLHLACSAGCVGMLLDAGADISLKNYSKMEPLHSVAQNLGGGFAINDAMKVLIDKGACVDSKDWADETPLHAVTHLIQGNVSTSNRYHLEQYMDAAQILLSSGADLYAPNKRGQTPLNKLEDREQMALKAIAAELKAEKLSAAWASTQPTKDNLVAAQSTQVPALTTGRRPRF